ncbi:hypothetical protein BGZ60DRAFT_511915 [Tricladium varicosporioides]|nr:hypothetical protein BGZ60DRAFT_511915 [Hymenoscyphus varicosporioides]
MSNPNHKNVLVLGGTGKQGLAIIRECLAHDLSPIVYVRSPSKLPSEITRNPNVTVVEGTIESAATDLYPHLSSVATIISALGPTSDVFYRKAHHKFSSLYSDILAQVAAYKTKPYLLALATPSYRHPNDKFSLLMFIGIILLKIIDPGARLDMIAIGKVFEEYGTGEGKVPWTVYRVANLRDEKPEMRKKERVAYAGYVSDGKWGINMDREEIARWLVRQAHDVLNRNEEGLKWIGKFPALSGSV